VSAAIILGGYGTFGALIAKELACAGITVTVAGRDWRRAETLARALGPAHRALALDLTDAAACLTALSGHCVAVNCAGSLADLGSGLLDVCLRADCHYTDIAVERAHATIVRSYGESFRKEGLTAVYGCSSLPAISGALALAASGPAARSRRATAVPERVRVTLFIGNQNPKGRSALESLVRILGQPLQTPQGPVLGFRDREVVVLPPPFGRRGVFNFDSPEYDLFPDLLGARAVSVKVGFDLRSATYGFALLAVLGWNWPCLVPWLQRIGTAMGWFGSSGGAVMTELFSGDGSRRCAALVARKDGQRMAALPCALAVRALCEGKRFEAGAMTAYEFLGADLLLNMLVAEGFELHRDPVPNGPAA
jgi:hypothetical protein